MQIFARNKYRFLNPEKKILQSPGTDTAQVMLKQVAFADAFFELEPDKFQDAPDWIQSDPMFKMAVSDGDIKIVQAGLLTDTSIPPVPDEPKMEPAEPSAAGDDVVAQQKAKGGGKKS